MPVLPKFPIILWLALLLLAPCCTSSKVPKTPLNSERIEAKFGSYGIEVLEHRPIRVSKLYSTHDGERICRTFAVVDFEKDIPDELQPELEKILGGASLGATLKKASWQITKDGLFLGSLKPGQRFLNLAGLKANWSGEVAIRIYQLNVQKSGTTTPFATIAEVHHPDYLTQKDLLQYARKDKPPTSLQQARVNSLLKIVKTEMAESP